MDTAILLASVIVVGLACLGFLMYFFVRLTNLWPDEERATRDGKISQPAWRKRSALVMGGNALAFFISLIVMIKGLQMIRDHIGLSGDDARAARYEACLERTSAEVCEIHWVRLPQPKSGDGPPILITPSGEIGIGLNP